MAQPGSASSASAAATLDDALGFELVEIEDDRAGFAALGLSNATSFFRPVTGGAVHAEAERIHRGRTTWVWDGRFTDESGRLGAASRVTVAVRRLDG